MAAVPQLERRRVMLADMNPLPYNPRVRLQPGTKKYEDLKRSIITFGEAGGIVWNSRTGNIVGGHQRYYILLDLEETTADATVVDLDDQAERALNIRLNIPGSDWDPELLRVTVGMIEREMREAAALDPVEDIMRELEHQHPDRFLDDISGMDAPPPGVGAPELKDDHPHRTGAQYFTYQLVLTGEQRDVYFEAIDRAKQVHNLDNSMDAITAVCEAYVRP